MPISVPTAPPSPCSPGSWAVLPTASRSHGPEEFDQPISLGLADKIHHAAFRGGPSLRSAGASSGAGPDRATGARVHIVHSGIASNYIDSTPTPLPASPRLLHIGPTRRAEGPADFGRGRRARPRPGLSVRADRHRRRAAPGRAGDADRRAEAGGSRQARRLEDGPGGLPGAAGLERGGAPQLRRGAADGDHGVAGPPPPGDLDQHRGYPRTGPRRRRPAIWSPPGDVGALADAMARFLETPAEELERIGEAGHQGPRPASTTSGPQARKLLDLVRDSAG